MRGPTTKTLLRRALYDWDDVDPSVLRALIVQYGHECRAEHNSDPCPCEAAR